MPAAPRSWRSCLSRLAGAYETLGLPPSDRLSRFRVKYLGCHHHYSIEKARVT